MSLPRYTPLTRGGPIKRGKATTWRGQPIVRFNKKRRAATFGRAYGSVERVEFVAMLPCACGCGRFPCENAHVVQGDGGGSYKASARYIAPLTTACHALLHTMGPESFQALHGIDLAECARRTETAWQAYREAAR